MSVRAYMSVIGPGVATPPTGLCGWSELFDMADYDAYVAKYSGAFRFWFPDETEGHAIADYLVVSGGALRLLGSSSSYYTEVAAPLSQPMRQWWARIVGAIEGGDYDGDAGHPFWLYVWSSTGLVEVDLTSQGSFPPQFYGLGTWGGGSGVWTNSSVSSTALPEGTHTFIVCVSEIDSTHFRSELWIDSTAGDAPLVTHDHLKDVGDDAFDSIVFGASSPLTPGRTTVLDSVEVVCGDRASNPFGIL